MIRAFDNPLVASGGIAVLKRQSGALWGRLKPSAASPELMQHRGRAVVFESIEDYKARIADPDLDVDATCVLVLKHCGPKGYPGMAEVGNMGLPPKVLRTGVKDMVRISDARMSGTAYGTAMLHVSPEAAAGGALALVKDGDMIELDVAARRLQLMVCDEELARRREAWQRSGSGHAARRLCELVHRARQPGPSRRRSRFPGRLPGPRGPARIALNRQPPRARDNGRKSDWIARLEDEASTIRTSWAGEARLV